MRARNEEKLNASPHAKLTIARVSNKRVGWKGAWANGPNISRWMEGSEGVEEQRDSLNLLNLWLALADQLVASLQRCRTFVELYCSSTELKTSLLILSTILLRECGVPGLAWRLHKEIMFAGGREFCEIALSSSTCPLRRGRWSCACRLPVDGYQNTLAAMSIIGVSGLPSNQSQQSCPAKSPFSRKMGSPFASSCVFSSGTTCTKGALRRRLPIAPHAAATGLVWSRGVGRRSPWTRLPLPVPKLPLLLVCFSLVC